MFVKYVCIKPSATGFDLYETNREDNEIYDDADIFNAITSLIELGSESEILCEDIEDITGLIHHEPDRVFYNADDGVYFGLDKADD